MLAQLREKMEKAKASVIRPEAVASAIIIASGIESMLSNTIMNLPKLPTGREPGAKRDKMNHAVNTAITKPLLARQEYKAACPES